MICINEEQALFVTIPTLSVPSALTFNIWPGAGDVIPLKIKDFVVGGIVTPAPVVESVSVSASKVEAQIGETIKYTANLTPYNAEAESVEWYVNGMQVEGDSLNFDYVAEQTGSCEVYCVVDGVASTSKTVTISEPSTTENNPNTPKKPVDSSAGVIIAIAIVVVVAAVAVIVIRKKQHP